MQRKVLPIGSETHSVLTRNEDVTMRNKCWEFSSIPFVLAVVAVAGIIWQAYACSYRKAQHTQAPQYTILEDDMGTIIQIGVGPDIDEATLRRVLALAADDRQDDEARDYLTANYLTVRAYLARSGCKGTVAAGELRRYIPPGNPRERKALTTDRRAGDTLTITIDRARQDLGTTCVNN